MASVITARRWLGPRLRRMATRSIEDVIQEMIDRTGLTAGDVMQVLHEVRDTLIWSARLGQAGQLEPLGTFTPTLGRDGGLRLHFRPSPRLKRALADRHAIHARIENKRSIEASDAELAAQWNHLHPDDPIMLGEEA